MKLTLPLPPRQLGPQLVYAPKNSQPLRTLIPHCTHAKSSTANWCWDCEVKRRRGTEELRLQVFWQLVQKTETCWNWVGPVNKAGYGEVYRAWRHNLAHRLSYKYAYGVVPPLLRHTCDNPKCVNPAHLLPGTHADKQADKVARNRQAKGERNGGGAKLTEAKVIEMRRLRRVGYKLKQLGTLFNVSQAVVGKICNGQLWKHVQP